MKNGRLTPIYFSPELDREEEESLVQEKAEDICKTDGLYETRWMHRGERRHLACRTPLRKTSIEGRGEQKKGEEQWQDKEKKVKCTFSWHKHLLLMFFQEKPFILDLTFSLLVFLFLLFFPGNWAGFQKVDKVARERKKGSNEKVRERREVPLGWDKLSERQMCTEEVSGVCQETAWENNQEWISTQPRCSYSKYIHEVFS